MSNQLLMLFRAKAPILEGLLSIYNRADADLDLRGLRASFYHIEIQRVRES